MVLKNKNFKKPFLSVSAAAEVTPPTASDASYRDSFVALRQTAPRVESRRRFHHSEKIFKDKKSVPKLAFQFKKSKVSKLTLTWSKSKPFDSSFLSLKRVEWIQTFLLSSQHKEAMVENPYSSNISMFFDHNFLVWKYKVFVTHSTLKRKSNGKLYVRVQLKTFDLFESRRKCVGIGTSFCIF